jgi:hypothetical protein
VPQRKEATANRMIEAVRYRRRPKRSVKNAVIGSTTTLDRM